MAFRDRADAGRRLAALLGDLAGEGAVVLGVPRGGVPVAAEVARALGAPLDVAVVRKIGAPIQPELAIGAVAEGGVALVDRGAAARVGVSPAELERLVAARRAEVEARVRALRGDAPPPDLRGATVVDRRRRPGHRARATWRPSRRHASAGPRGWWWPRPSGPSKPSRCWPRRPVTACARWSRDGSAAWVAGTSTSARCPTTRSARSWPTPGRRPDAGPGRSGPDVAALHRDQRRHRAGDGEHQERRQVREETPARRGSGAA